MNDVSVVCEEDGVVGNDWVTGGQDASGHQAHTVQDAIIDQEIIYQQLDTSDIQTLLLNCLLFRHNKHWFRKIFMHVLKKKKYRK